MDKAKYEARRKVIKGLLDELSAEQLHGATDALLTVNAIIGVRCASEHYAGRIALDFNHCAECGDRAGVDRIDFDTDIILMTCSCRHEFNYEVPNETQNQEADSEAAHPAAGETAESGDAKDSV